MELPKFIISSINKNETSIGDNPAIPPGDENNFVLKIIRNAFNELTDGIDKSVIELRSELYSMIKECKSKENGVREELEKICMDSVLKIIQIPSDTVTIISKICDNISSKNQRLIPDSTEDYTFESIEDMENLTKEIYKRRFLDALIYGIAINYSLKYDLYVNEVFNLNPDLPSLYVKIMKYNTILSYVTKDSINYQDYEEAGSVDVFMYSSDESVKMVSKGIIFPVLLYETIKGILELCISHGLPEEISKAEYIIKKSDFKLADNWDYRIGYALWRKIEKTMEKNGIEIDKYGVHYFTMQLSMIPCDKFNHVMREILAGTKLGVRMLKDMLSDIKGKIDKDDFETYINNKNKEYNSSHQESFFSPDELIIKNDTLF